VDLESCALSHDRSILTCQRNEDVLLISIGINAIIIQLIFLMHVTIAYIKCNHITVYVTLYMTLEDKVRDLHKELF
jgi:hypothetical protein